VRWKRVVGIKRGEFKLDSTARPFSMIAESVETC